MSDTQRPTPGKRTGAAGAATQSASWCCSCAGTVRSTAIFGTCEAAHTLTSAAPLTMRAWPAVAWAAEALLPTYGAERPGRFRSFFALLATDSDSMIAAPIMPSHEEAPRSDPAPLGRVRLAQERRAVALHALRARRRTLAYLEMDGNWSEGVCGLLFLNPCRLQTCQ